MSTTLCRKLLGVVYTSTTTFNTHRPNDTTLTYYTDFVRRLRSYRQYCRCMMCVDKDDPRRLAQLLSAGRVDANMQFSGVDPLGKALFWSPLHFCCEKGRRRWAMRDCGHWTDGLTDRPIYSIGSVLTLLSFRV